MVKQEAEHNSQRQDDAAKEKKGDPVGELDLSELVSGYHEFSIGSIF
jgi:hypothetical protein